MATSVHNTPARGLVTGSDYTQALFDSLVRLGDRETERGKYFERVFVYYAGIAPDFATDVDKIQRAEVWSADPNSGWDGPKIDVGIDFVLTMKSPTDKPIAVQTKFTTRTLGKDALDGIGVQTITQDRLGMFSRQIVVSNVDRENLSSVLIGEAARTNISVLGREWFDEINDGLLAQGKTPPTTLDEVESLISKPVKPALLPLALLPHQEKIHAQVMQTLLKTDRTTIHAACGIGKTLSAWALFDSLVPANQVGVVYTPALSLVDGIIRSFKRQQTPDNRYDIRAVCSDKTVGGTKTFEDQDMSPSQVHAQVMSNPDDIRAWLQSPTDGRRRLLVATYQSSEKVAQAVAGTDTQFALQINDEAHQLAGTGAFGKHAWDVPSAKIVSLTATPRVTKLKASAGENVTVTSMSDEALFGAQSDWAVYPISQGIKDKVLAPYVIEILVTPHADDVNSETRVDDNDHDARMAAIAKVTTDVRNEENNGKGSSIVFFNSRARSKKYASFHKSIDNSFPVEHVDGETHVSERRNAIDRIVQTGGVLTNVAVLNEGVDIPSLNAVVFADAKGSKVNIIQSIGRVDRIDRNNPDKVGRVIIPVAVKDGVDPEEAVANSDFSQVWEVIKAVCDHDDTFMHDMIEIRRQLGRGERPRIPSSLRDKMRIIASGGTTLVNPQWDDPGFLDEFMTSVTTQAVRSIVPNWYETYERVVQFVSEHDRLPSKGSKDEEEHRLGVWCNTQRQARKKGNLNAERVAQLETIPGWYWEQDVPTWEESHTLLVDFVRKHDRLPSRGSKDEEEHRLGTWCTRQRQAHKKGNLSAEQVALLETIPGWFWEQSSLWEKTHTLLGEFVREHDRLPSQRGKDEKERKLGKWCSDQRKARKKGQLSAERVALLETIPGWYWEQSSLWGKTHTLLGEFVREYNRLPSMKSKDEEECKLGNWCKTQRQYRKKGKLSAECVALLETIPGWFWGQDMLTWEESHTLVGEFVRERNRLPYEKSKDEEERRLGKWCTRQRQARKNGNLSAERVALLETIPGWYWSSPRVK